LEIRREIGTNVNFQADIGQVKQSDSPDETCFRLLTTFINQLNKSNEIDKYQIPAMYGISNKIDYFTPLECLKGSLNLAQKDLNDHNKKLSFLDEIGGQMLDKLRDLDQLTGSLLNYGTHNLQPWRESITTMTENILNGARCLEAKVENTFDGCAELERRIIKLEDELLNVRRENELLKQGYTALESQVMFLLTARESERHIQYVPTSGENGTGKSLNEEFEALKLHCEQEVNRLESLIVDRLIINYKDQDNIGKDKTKESRLSPLEEKVNDSKDKDTFVIERKENCYEFR